MFHRRWVGLSCCVVFVLSFAVLRLDQPRPAPDHTLADTLPAAVRAHGYLSVATDPSYPPIDSVDTTSHAVVGFDRDLLTAVADRLGLRLRWRVTTFDDVLDGVHTGRDDLGAAAIPVTDPHLDRTLLVTYLTSGTQWLVPGHAEITVPDACGKHVAVVSSTTQTDDLTDRSAACRTAGRAAISADRYPTLVQAAAAVAQERATALITDTAGAAYVTSDGSRLQLAGRSYDTVPLGIAVNPTRRALADTIQATLAALIADGTYRRIADRWHLGPAAAATATVRP